MGIFTNLQTSLFQIKSSLKGNSDLRKLLYYGTSDALAKDDVDYSLINDYIYLNPVFNINVEPFNKSNFITINLVEFSENKEESLFEGALRVNIMCKNTLWELDDEKIRPLEIIENVYNLLNNRKFDISHKLHFMSSQLVVLNEEISGYMVIFGLEEGAGWEYEF